LRAPDAPIETANGAAHQIVEWSGGTLDDLVSLLSGPAWSARVEVFAAGASNPIGEVHVIAGGVSDAIFEGKSTHEALDNLRAVKSTRFRVEPRLPNPSDGDLTFPGPEQGKLEERPLAHLMRYCEDYVLTSGIEVWRGSENAKVDYRRGDIVGVTVGGIDAPERLAEVMKWSSGSYRLIVPRLTLPATAPKAAAPAAVVAPRSAAAAASKTIFGMPALDPTALAAATDKAKAAPAQAQPKGTAAASAPSGPRPIAATPAAPLEATTVATAAKPSPMVKTMVGVAPPKPAPASVEPAAAPAAPPAKAGRPTAPASGRAAPPNAAAPTSAAAETDRTIPTKTPKPRPNETPVWTYVGVGFIFGLALLGVYRLVIVLAH
jgi:hypothetical protein